MTSHKILILTDLHWTKSSLDITAKDIESIKTKNIVPTKDIFSKIHDYINLIKTHRPDLILFGGDLTGDGSCGHGYHFAFIYLLQYLENCKINSVFIKGNHDDDEYYNKVFDASSKFKFTQEISGKYVEVNGLKLVGLSFEDTHDKARLKEIISVNKKVDIVLAHAELSRRPWLFDFDTKYIITGHYDYKFNYINNKVFLSFFNDYPHINYGIIDVQKQKDLISYFLSSESFKPILINAQKDNKGFSYIPVKETAKLPNVFRERVLYDIVNSDFKSGIEQILNTKTKFKSLNTKLTRAEFTELVKLDVNSSMKISKTMVIDYLGNSLIEK